MEYAYVKVPAAPIRRKAKHQSEMTNQLLFGDAVKVIKEKGELWVKVRCIADDYEGWITRNLVQEVENVKKEYQPWVAGDLINSIEINGQRMQIPAGATLPGFNEGRGSIGSLNYQFDGRAENRAEHPLTVERIHHLTMPWLNAPYMWGGKTIMGVDCSGFVQVNFKMMGLDLPRDAWQQAQEGETVEKLKLAVCGDLAFFDDKDEIVHVGILLDSERIIHASGRVRIDQIDKKGIINGDTGKRTHSLRLIKRCR